MTHNVTKHNVPFANEDNVLLTTKDKKKIAVCAGKQKTGCWIITSVVGFFVCIFFHFFWCFLEISGRPPNGWGICGKNKSSIKIHIISRDREKENSLKIESRMIQAQADFEMKKCGSDNARNKSPVIVVNANRSLHRLSPRQACPFSRSSPKVNLAGMLGTPGIPRFALGTTLRASAASASALLAAPALAAGFLGLRARELLEPEPMARTL